uniref:non-specific protein-tyrosine kinase n=1 Tax=Xenopus tropicalis TaxID=8364 RepID=A0A803K3W9_XENTR
MAAADLRDELTCSICQDIYTDPVTLPCGHNFCRGCIEKTWDWQKSIEEDPSCPECRERYRRQPDLKRNLRLSNIAKRLFSTHPEPDGTGNSGNRTCSAHNEPLKYLCCEDGACICESCCLAGGHRGHRVELSEASEKKKEKLRKVLEKLSPEREETERGAQRLQERRRELEEKAAIETERVTVIFGDIREELKALEKQLLLEISRQKEELSLTLTELIQQLEIKKDELSREIRHIEELCNMADPLTVLQAQWESHGAAFCGAEGADTEGREREDTEGADTEGREREGIEGADNGSREREDTEGADTEGREREDTEGADTEGREREDTEGADTEGREREGTEGADNGGRERGGIKDPAVGDLDVGRISETLLTGLAGIVTGVKGWIYGQEATELILDTNSDHHRTPEGFQGSQAVAQQSDQWERPRSEFKLVKHLEAGDFGEVWEGLWNDKDKVAIKTFKEANESHLKNEVDALKTLRHRNLIQLYAVCSVGEPVYIVTELMSKGSLLQFLKGNEGPWLTDANSTHIISQVAEGMAYLENKHVLHITLAARNVLVGEELLCKIADFGLARILKSIAWALTQMFGRQGGWPRKENLK